MDVREFVEGHRNDFVAALKEWVAIPSVSADPTRHGDVRRSAEWLRDHLRAAGFPTAEVWETGGLPAVFAEWPAADPAAPTVLVYGHHDVQPARVADGWDTDPFVAEERGDRLVGRGTSDDKGQVLFHTLGVKAAIAASGGSAPPVTVRLLVEGEEESGSPHFAELLRANRDRLACDVVVISDTTMWGADTPSMCVGMRGLTDCEISLTGPRADVHSGSFGGAVPNPARALAALLADLHDADGRVAVPGFYDDVVEISDTERALIARLPFDEAEWLRTAGAGAAAGEAGYSTLERVWVRPTAEVNGLWGGHTGAGTKTIVPRSAHAKVSFRLVPDQEPARVQEAVRAFVAERVPAGLRAEVVFNGPGVRPCASDLDSAALRAARSAMERAFGTEVLFTREGGSGPEADIADILRAPLVFVAVGLNDDRIHAPNEKVEIPLLLKGAESAAYLWEHLAVGAPHAG
ncbi:dipeptidase [Streptomonospora nanhaiensis]|uniref:Acetylornithine deacetylase/succinyl-diaminopimelate desuccinylase-like protein n=1 Tax=Streptomonospora nanhaiensis TaxID=1323731 RepID=A0A853BSR0_9ACTN|nr:dipeptidase [Streptomonospora nanhaiensis]MBV2362727.1 dipeptidase [Streptomonospora nanhaiensis]MBX9390976.1 dipeptidase [Streptomonospora nanhaiensis]NYI97924.1 acetylornithine deacetylase/succinyl-diaminopimelate desuccinylase-like protein [Streptomonospora nanhaiensis]